MFRYIAGEYRTWSRSTARRPPAAKPGQSCERSYTRYILSWTDTVTSVLWVCTTYAYCNYSYLYPYCVYAVFAPWSPRAAGSASSSSSSSSPSVTHRCASYKLIIIVIIVTRTGARRVTRPSRRTPPHAATTLRGPNCRPVRCFLAAAAAAPKRGISTGTAVASSHRALEFGVFFPFKFLRHAHIITVMYTYFTSVAGRSINRNNVFVIRTYIRVRNNDRSVVYMHTVFGA